MNPKTCAATIALWTMASTAGAQDPTAAASRCRLQGAHVSGVVSVDLGTGARAELPLVDVVAHVTLAREAGETTFEVSSPLVFRGTYVSGSRGAPGVHASRAFRSADGSSRIAADATVEARLAAAEDQATVSAPLEWGNGALEVDVPCSALSAGAARVGMTATRAPARGEFVRIAPDAVLRVTADPASAEFARIVRANATESVLVRGRIARPVNGFVRVSLTVGPLSVDAFVAEGAVQSADRDLVPPGAPITRYSVTSTLGDSERESREVTLATATPVFADRRVTVPWATVASPIRATLSRRVGSTYRFALEFTHATFPTFPCRSDGVAGYPACGETGSLPRIGLMSCPAGSCTQVAYVDDPGTGG